MIEAIIARRYAKALFELTKDGDLPAFLGQVEGFGRLLVENPNLEDVLSNRFIDTAARLRVLDDIGQKSGWDSLVTRFFKLLVRKGRSPFIAPIVAQYRAYVLAAQNKVEATVTSAVALQPEIIEKITAELSRVTGKQVVLEKKVDANVLGGLLLKVGNEYFDGTIRNELNRMTEKMKQAPLA